MTPLVIWNLVKTVGPWVVLAIVIAGVGLLVVDRNHLAALNQTHQACVASVQGKPGSQPIGSVCEAPIVAAATTATQANACDALLVSTPDGVPAVCSKGVQTLAATVAAQASTIASQAAALAEAKSNTDAAVARASARATQAAIRSANAQAVLAASPHDAAGDVVLNADGLRKLAGQQ